MRKNSRRTGLSFRNGLSLLELLAVIVLIGILAAVITAVSLRSVGSARVQSTKSTITRLRVLLNQRMAAFDRLNLSEWKIPESTKAGIDISDPIVAAALVTTTPAVTATYPTSTPNYREIAGGNTQLAAVLLRKGAFRRYFPQTWAEVAAWGLDAETGITVPASSAAESAEVLLWLLTAAPCPGYSPDGLDGLPTLDTNGNGFPELVDAWDQPLRFIRWPTRLIRFSGLGNGIMAPPAPPVMLLDGPRAMLGNSMPDKLLDSDPSSPGSAIRDYPFAIDLDDPLFLTANVPGWAISNFEDAFHTPWTWSLPLIISAGPDGDTGILPVSTASPPGQLGGFLTTAESLMFDNITNLNIKSGGK